MRSEQYVLLVLDDRRYAVVLSSVRSVVRAAALLHVLESKESVLGLLNIGGQLIPVLNLRLRLGLPCRTMDIDHRIVIADVHGRAVAFVVDSVDGVVSAERQTKASDQFGVLNPNTHVSGLLKVDGATMLVLDIERIAAADEITVAHASAGERSGMTSARPAPSAG